MRLGRAFGGVWRAGLRPYRVSMVMSRWRTTGRDRARCQSRLRVPVDLPGVSDKVARHGVCLVAGASWTRPGRSGRVFAEARRGAGAGSWAGVGSQVQLVGAGEKLVGAGNGSLQKVVLAWLLGRAGRVQGGRDGSPPKREEVPGRARGLAWVRRCSWWVLV